MNNINALPIEWQNWIRHSIARNVADELLIEAMVKANFNHAFAVRIIAELRDKPRAEVAPLVSPLTGDWEHWLAENIERGVPERRLIDRASYDIRAAWAKRLAFLRQAEAARKDATSEKQEFGAMYSTTDRTGPILFELDQPRMVLFGNLLAAEECDALIALAKPFMAPSQVIDHSSGEAIASSIRHSEGASFAVGQTALIAQVERRIAELVHRPVEFGEGLQILKYGIGGEYIPHFDFFPADNPAYWPMLKSGGQRVGTMIFYLNTVDEGGETVFPKLHLRIKPVQGNALFFSYPNTNREHDQLTLHAGQPVKQGQKWIMTKWLRQSQLRPTPE